MLTFSIAVGSGSNGLQAMLPTAGPSGTLETLTRDGNPVAYQTADDQGHRVRRLHGRRPAPTRPPTTSTSTAPVITAVKAVAGRPRRGHGDLDDRRAGDRRASTSGPRPAPSARSRRPGAHDRPTRCTSPGSTADTTYYFRVSLRPTRVGNTATVSRPRRRTATFTTPTGVATDTTVADFGRVRPARRPTSSDTAGGEVILAPTVGAEFDGTGHPGRLVDRLLDRRRAPSSAAATPPSTAPGCVPTASVGAGRARRVRRPPSPAPRSRTPGSASTLDGGGESWAMFGTNATAGRPAGPDPQPRRVDRRRAARGAVHRIRAPRSGSSGTPPSASTSTAPSSTRAATVSGTMRPIASDFATGGGAPRRSTGCG